MKNVLHPRGQGTEEMRRKPACFQQRLESAHFAVVTLGIACPSAGTNGSASSQKEIGGVTWWQVQQAGSSVGRDNIRSTYNTHHVKLPEAGNDIKDEWMVGGRRERHQQIAQ